MPPPWKLRREVARIAGQVSRFVAHTLYDPPRQVLYDLTAKARVHVRMGNRPCSARVAVFVLYQPSGLAKSTLFTLEHLLQKGWSPIVVSNAPLSKGDWAELVSRSSVVIERPNVGYDFGAYREGIRYLNGVKASLDKLILMNDSTWFPLREDDDTLEKMERSGADLVGHIFKTEDAEDRGRDHLESHLLMFGTTAIRHEAFGRFWSKYVMSNSRVTTIRNGEKGLSKAFVSTGLKIKGLLTRDSLIALLEGLDDTKFADSVRNVVHHQEDTRRDVGAMIENMPNDRSDRRQFIEWVSKVLSSSRQFLISTTFIAPAMKYGGLSFVKKADDLRFHLARKKVLYMEKANEIYPLHETVRAEIARSVEVLEQTMPPHSDHNKDATGDS
jgi:hypothetical protein